MKLSDAQKEAIRAYNTESGSSLSLRFSFLRVGTYNKLAFFPLLPLPTQQQLQKAAIDERYYSKKTSRSPMGRGDTPSGRGRGRGRGGSKTPMSLLDMPMIAQPLFSINTGVLEALIEKAVTKAVEKAVEKAVTKAMEELVVPLLNKGEEEVMVTSEEEKDEVLPVSNRKRKLEEKEKKEEKKQKKTPSGKEEESDDTQGTQETQETQEKEEEEVTKYTLSTGESVWVVSETDTNFTLNTGKVMNKTNLSVDDTIKFLVGLNEGMLT